MALKSFSEQVAADIGEIAADYYGPGETVTYTPDGGTAVTGVRAIRSYAQGQGSGKADSVECQDGEASVIHCWWTIPGAYLSDPQVGDIVTDANDIPWVVVAPADINRGVVTLETQRYDHTEKTARRFGLHGA